MDMERFNNAIAFAATLRTATEDPASATEGAKVAIDLQGEQALMDMAGALAVLFNLVVDHSARRSGIGYDEAVARIVDVLRQQGVMGR